MKTVGIMTFHMAFNHGAMLQAYGLSKKLELMGVKAVIIDYRLPFIDRYHHKDVLQDLWRKQGVIGALKFIKRTLRGDYSDPAWSKFYCFMTKRLPLSKQILNEDFSKVSYDSYIVGSDQVWNGDLTGGIQPCYFLEFAPASSKRIAYAASCGGKDFGSSDIACIKKWLKKFTAIGIREDSLTNYVREQLKIPAETVLDPTLILGKTNWVKLAHRVPYEKYVLIYTFDEKHYIYEKAREYATKRNLKIITIAYEQKDIGEDIIQLLGQGPEDFISYIYYAEAVFTSSFHGTAFSIIFEKEFYCFPHPKYHERTDNLLAIAKLLDRYVYEGDELKYKTIDYNEVNKLMQPAIKASEEFLMSSILE